MRITNDLLLAANDGQVGCLVLLDLSAAFDTIDHRILLQKLSSRLHLSKSAAHWFASYLEDRYQKVVIGDEISSNFKLQYGVQQGSVLGPLLFTLYTVDLGEIIKKHGLSYHMYADDIQLYISFSLTDAETSMQRLEACIRDINIWMVKKQTKTKWGEDRGPLHIQGWLFVQTFYETIANWWNRHSSFGECEESWSDTGQLSDP